MKTNRKQIAKSIRKNWQLYLFLLIPVVYVIVFKYVPMGGVVIAFKDFKLRHGIWGSEWVGFEHFIRFFSTYQCRKVIKNTLIISFYSLIAGFPIPIIFALMMNCVSNEKIKKTVQSIVCLPHFISTVVMVGIIFQLFNPRLGLYGIIAEALTGTYPSDINASPDGFRHLYIWSGVWKGFGWGSIIYTAALAGVDPTYHEAAQMDGATRLQRIIHIDLPSITPTIITLLILRVGDLMSVGFEKVYLMQNGMNLAASEIISTYVYSVGLGGSTTNFSYAAAIGLFNSVINLILIVIVNKLARKYSETSLW